jgi:hypothetical protein
MMAKVNILFHRDEYPDVDVIVPAEKVGQLAICRTMYLIDTHTRSPYWQQVERGEWDIIHIASNRRVDTLNCNHDMSLKVAKALGELDFDSYSTLKSKDKKQFYRCMSEIIARLTAGKGEW